ncbi:hypothetical protein CDAR_484171 [Caerostris darwini]|uniref:Uncharacterized protein n=1 Tax=Caerostris darwini TaxID=1538125 RepID=A0AAV4T996_9ARAC|nr:hypothetical protein CDAR_484171 [Caerostris darwini]
MGPRNNIERGYRTRPDCTQITKPHFRHRKGGNYPTLSLGHSRTDKKMERQRCLRTVCAHAHGDNGKPFGGQIFQNVQENHLRSCACALKPVDF